MSTLVGWWAAVWPNLAANVLWVAPAFLTHHKLLKRHVDRQHAATQEHITAVTERNDG